MASFPDEFYYPLTVNDFIYVYRAWFHKGSEMVLSDLVGNF